jgi:hypothetical protein
MFKNFIIAILVLSNLAFLMFALYQKNEAKRMVELADKHHAMAEFERNEAAKVKRESQSTLMILQETNDSLRNELARNSQIIR